MSKLHVIELGSVPGARLAGYSSVRQAAQSRQQLSRQAAESQLCVVQLGSVPCARCAVSIRCISVQGRLLRRSAAKRSYWHEQRACD
jgi:hypothetical protein